MGETDSPSTSEFLVPRFWSNSHLEFEGHSVVGPEVEAAGEIGTIDRWPSVVLIYIPKCECLLERAARCGRPLATKVLLRFARPFRARQTRAERRPESAQAPKSAEGLRYAQRVAPTRLASNRCFELVRRTYISIIISLPADLSRLPIANRAKKCPPG